MRPAPDVADLVRFAVGAERAGIDGVMVSEHILLGPSADEAGLPANPRDYALPGNQDPASPWPSPLSCSARWPRIEVRRQDGS